MKNAVKAYLLVAGIALYSGAVLAQQQKTDPGKQEYDAKCAVCHGVNGRGDGPMAEHLRQRPSDLTIIAKKNGGVLPTSKLIEVIEGKNVPSHGSLDMPIWGKEFRAEDAMKYREAHGGYDEAAVVRARVLMLIDYISRIQAR